MSTYTVVEVIQSVGGTVGGTVEASVGHEVKCGWANWATLFVDYVKGTEGTLYVYPKFKRAASGTAYQWQDFGATAGDKTATTNRLKFTANASAYHTFDVRGLEYMQFYSLVAGTPSGGLGLHVVLSGD